MKKLSKQLKVQIWPFSQQNWIFWSQFFSQIKANVSMLLLLLWDLQFPIDFFDKYIFFFQQHFKFKNVKVEIFWLFLKKKQLSKKHLRQTSTISFMMIFCTTDLKEMFNIVSKILLVFCHKILQKCFKIPLSNLLNRQHFSSIKM